MRGWAPALNVLVTLLWGISSLVPLLLVARVICAPFYSKVARQIREHPVAHIIWALLALPWILFGIWMFNPGLWPPTSSVRKEQRRTVLERVQPVGGWDVVRRQCEAWVTNYPNGLQWSPAHQAWVYPNPQTQPHRYYVTNVDYGPLPPALAALQPREVFFYPPRFLPPSSNGAPVEVMHIKIFGMHRTGMSAIPYYGLEIPLGQAADGYRPKAVEAASGNGHSEYRQLADRVYEIY